MRAACHAVLGPAADPVVRRAAEGHDLAAAHGLHRNSADEITLVHGRSPHLWIEEPDRPRRHGENRGRRRVLAREALGLGVRRDDGGLVPWGYAMAPVR